MVRRGARQRARHESLSVPKLRSATPGLLTRGAGRIVDRETSSIVALVIGMSVVLVISFLGVLTVLG